MDHSEMVAVDSRLAVRLVAERALAEFSPAHSPLFPLLAAAYLADPERILTESNREERLGFGPGGSEIMVIGTVVFVASSVIQQLIARVTDDVIARVPRPGKKKQDADDHQPELLLGKLSADDLALAWDTALEVGRRCRLSETEARELADAIKHALSTR